MAKHTKLHERLKSEKTELLAKIEQLRARGQPSAEGREGSPLSLEQGFFPGLPPYGLTYRTYLPENSGKVCWSNRHIWCMISNMKKN